MDWLHLIFISLTAYSFGTIVQKLILNDDKVHPISFSIIFQTINGIAFILAALIFSDLDFQGIINLWPYVLLGCLLYAATNFFSFLSLQKIDASKYTIIFASRGLFTVIASTLFLNETLDSVSKIIGVILIILGVVVVTIDKFDRSLFQITKFEAFGLLAALAVGLANTNDSVVLKQMDIFTYTGVVFIIPALILAIISKSGRTNIKPLLNLKFLPKIVLFSILIFISAFTFFSALEIHNSAEVSSVNLLGTVLTVLLGIILLHERRNILKKIVGSVLSILGLLLITLA